MTVNVVCRNWEADYVLPRFARYLADGLGWTLTAAPVNADVHYLMGYFESQLFKKWPKHPTAPWPRNPVASLFTHREERHAAKAALYDEIAQRVDLRVSMCRLYGQDLEKIGPTIQPPLPVERNRFILATRPRAAQPVVGLSGFAYATGRKGEALVRELLRHPRCPKAKWSACGRGWPVPTRIHTWKDMPAFYASLDVLVCPSLVEGGPMPVLEALSSGVSVVVPRGVGILDELPDTPGIYRYPRGNVGALAASLSIAVQERDSVDRCALREVTAGYTVEAWCAGNAAGVARLLAEAA
jgi:glycosyltransferase involved in cell wall biosynthesis